MQGFLHVGANSSIWLVEFRIHNLTDLVFTKHFSFILEPFMSADTVSTSILYFSQIALGANQNLLNLLQTVCFPQAVTATIESNQYITVYVCKATTTMADIISVRVLLLALNAYNGVPTWLLFFERGRRDVTQSLDLVGDDNTRPWRMFLVLDIKVLLPLWNQFSCPRPF